MMATDRRPDPAELAYMALRTAQTRFQRAPDELEPAQQEAVRLQAAREWLVEQRILESDEARGLILPESAVDQAVAELSARYEDEDAFAEGLAAHGVEAAALRRALRRQMVVEAVLEKVAARAPTISDVDVSLFYFSHLERFSHPELRQVRHILITINPDYPENCREQVAARIATIAERLASKPHRFAEQAQKHSECPSAIHGGLLGKVPAGQLYPELDRVLFSMKEGEISAPVESEVGLHLLWCEQIIPAGRKPLAEVRETIRSQLRERAARQCQKHWLNARKREAEHG